MAKKKSTKDIMAALRAEAAKKSGGETPGDSESAASESGEEKAAAPKAPAKKGAAPKSTKDIMAALRAEAKGGGASSESAPKPAAKKPAAKKPAAKKPLAETGGEKPSVQEMLKAAREGAPVAQESAKATPKKPVAAGKLRAAKNKAAQDDQDRRVFLLAWLYSPFILAWLMLGAASAAFLLGLARFLMPNVLVEPPSKFKVGPPGEFPPGTVATKYKSEYGIWIVNTLYQGQQLIYALRSVCTHLGCTPSWLEGEQKFKCPCHGSGFYIDGINFEGPAPRPLERVGIALAPDGLLEVDKSLTFQQEMGQWDDPASYYQVG